MQAQEIKSAPAQNARAKKGILVVRKGAEQWADDSPAAKELTMGMTKLICSQLLPFHLIDSEEWKHFMSLAAPKYRVVSSSYVNNNALPELYANIRKKIESRIATTARSINICVDGWSSLTHVQYISIIIQWLTKNFKMHSYVLSTRSLQSEHSADNIAAAIGETLREFNIDASKVGCVTVGNGTHYISAIQKLNLNQSACVCHTLQLCILDALKKDSTTWSIYVRAKALVEAFRRSPALEGQLIAVQQRRIAELHRESSCEEESARIKRLQMACDTRWSSFYHMLDRICILKESLQILSEVTIDLIQVDENNEHLPVGSNLKNTFRKLEDIMLTPQECGVAMVLRDTLTRFYIMSNRAESTFCPISEIPAFVKRAREELKDVRQLATFHAQLRRSLKQRFYDKYSDSTLLAVAVDPRYKSLNCLVDEKANDDALPTHAIQLFQAAVMSEARSAATAEQNEAIQAFTHDDAAVTAESTTQPAPAKRSKQTDQQYDISMKESDAIMLFGSMQSESGLSDFESTIKCWETKARLQISTWQTMYFNVPLNVDPLDWWRKNYYRFPLIAQVACKVLSIPASAAACERLWSKAELVLSPRRATLPPEHVNKYLFICMNSDACKDHD